MHDTLRARSRFHDVTAAKRDVSITGFLHHWCTFDPTKPALTVARGGTEAVYDYLTLLRRASAMAAMLAERSQPLDRILILMPTSPEFIDTFFGCIVSGRIAVPLPIEKRGARFSRVGGVVSDCTPRLAVARTRQDLENMGDLLSSVDTVIIDEIRLPEAMPDEVIHASEHPAFIQYTSGSTSAPKGVVLTHGNILANARMITTGMDVRPTDRVVSWLPLYHDLGLIGMLLTPLWDGLHTFIYPPEEFARDPSSWLVNLSSQNGTITGAPNFALDLIVRKLKPEVLTRVDLSKVRALYCGGERISGDTVRAFYKHLEGTGLKTRTFFPTYGMAEATVYISGGFKDASQSLAPAGSKNAHSVSCGLPAQGLKIRMASGGGVDAGSEETGEIEICGPSISPGYWQTLAEHKGFAEPSKPDGDRWLSTGDLGFLCGGELVVTGRMKDLVRVRGRNIHPEDLEGPIEAGMADMVPSNGAVVVSSNSADGSKEYLTVVVEIDRKHRRGPFNELMARVQTIVSQWDVRCERVVVLPPLTMPKTSSGKKQRRRTAQLLNAGQLPVLWDSLQTVLADERALHRPAIQPVPVKLETIKSYFRAIDPVLADERRTFPPDFLKILHEGGLLALLVPTQHGGSGITHAQFAELGNELGQIDVSLAAIVGIQNTIGLLPIIWSDFLRDRDSVLQSVASRGDAVAFALTEPNAAGSNPRGITSSVNRRNGRLLISGEKTWIGNSTFARYINIFVQEFDEAGASIGISAFLLRAGVHGFHIGAEQLTLGVRAMPQARLTLQDVEVSDADRLSKPGRGLALAYRAMEYGRFGLASVAAGALRTALDRTHHYAAARQIATGRLSENGHYKVAIGEVLLETDALDAVVRIVGEHLDRTGELPQLYSLTCKILAGETGFTGVDRALQFTGGRGYTETFGLGRIWRDIRLLRIFEGPTEAVSAHLGSLVLRRPDIVLDAFASSDRDGKDQAVAEASRLVKMAAALHGSSEGLEAFVVELGIFTARQVAIAALLMSCTNEQVRSAAQFKRNALSFALGIRINEIAGLAAAFEALSRPQRASAQEPRTAPIFDTWSGSISSPVGSEHLPGDEAGRDVATPLEKVTPRPVISHEPPSRPPRPATAEATAWLVAWIAKATKTHVMDPDHFLTGCGIDSLLAFELHCSIEEEFNIRLPESIFTEDLTIRQLGERIGGKMNTAADA